MYLSGANAFLNKKIFLSIGGFNEMFSPFYVEDVELSIRAWRLGYTCYFDYNAVCRHKTSSTILKGNNLGAIHEIYSRNKMYLHAIHLDNFKKSIWFVQILFESIVHFLALRWSYIRALIQFFKNYRSVITFRQQLMQCSGNKKLLSFGSVVSKILVSLKGKEINQF
jgi:GT2 family glycosyltransferase